jgi:SNF2 family DNA or RNA helicase
MLNFRKLKQDFSSNVLEEGKDLHFKDKVVSAKILKLDRDTVRITAKVLGNYNNTYESEIEIDRFESETIHSNCDCSYRYDCQHLAALLYYLEEKIDSLLVQYSKEEEVAKTAATDKELLKTLKQAETKEEAKQDANYQKQVIQEYAAAADLLASSPFFLPLEEKDFVKAELAFIFNPAAVEDEKRKRVEYQLALRLPFRSKPLQVGNLKEFFDAVAYEECLGIASKRYYFSMNSFENIGQEIIKTLMNKTEFSDKKENDRSHRIGVIEKETLGILLAAIYEKTIANSSLRSYQGVSEDLPDLPGVFYGTLETPLHFSFTPPVIQFDLQYIEPPSEKLLLHPNLIVDGSLIQIDKAYLFESSHPGMIYQDIYYKFPSHIKRLHLRNLGFFKELCVPKPLFGSFVENALPELKRYAQINNENVIEQFVTLPYAKNLSARCALSYLDGELEASLFFTYDKGEIHALSHGITYETIKTFVTDDGVIARNLTEEKKILDELFQDFVYQPLTGTYQTKSEKKIVEFMTDIIPKHQNFINFECPQNLLDQFIYDQTTYEVHLDYKDKVGFFELKLKVDGELRGVGLDLLWECVGAKRSFIELATRKTKSQSLFSKILVLDLEKISKIVQIFDEMGIKKLDNATEDKPLWNLVSVNEKSFENLPVKFTMTNRVKEIQKQILGEKDFSPSPIPKHIAASIRPYQVEGVHWLEKLRSMYLNGILADDMGLGKTLQAIIAITQCHENEKNRTSIVVCPTSLLYNWKEEIGKFNPKLKVVIVDGVPNQRKKMIDNIKDIDVAITSYTLMQKDVELYKNTTFAYAILDEAQHIKNRATCNAKSVKMIQASHRLILTGTPIENCLSDLWSLFDFLMPNLLSSFDRFAEKYIRGIDPHQNMEHLKKKASPFILRRMKTDVLKDLPPVSEILYHTQLSPVQEELYKSYAASAKEELIKLVQKEGFEKIQIHVLATLTRLKQICCHPAIFAKEKAEPGDSAKYEMLLELLETLIEGEHKIVIFSQYTQMLDIMRQDFNNRGIQFSYLDGTTKNRLDVVKEFNENKKIPIFLVSLKAGGVGLNITGADTVIHYDMWWNPAVENQATDRVHRIGQTKSVSAYKLITVGTIEEKIVELQKKKKGLVKKVVNCDDEAIAKLTWEDVLELLKT